MIWVGKNLWLNSIYVYTYAVLCIIACITIWDRVGTLHSVGQMCSHLLSSMKFGWSTGIPVYLCGAWGYIHATVAVTETIRPLKPKTFAIWPFVKTVSGYWSSSRIVLLWLVQKVQIHIHHTSVFQSICHEVFWDKLLFITILENFFLNLYLFESI